MDIRHRIRIANKRTLSLVGWVRELVAAPWCRSSTVHRSRLLHRASKIFRRRDPCRLQERGDSRLRLRLQQDLARADRFPERRRKLIDHRRYLQHHSRPPGESRSLRQQWARARSVRLHRLLLHLSSLEQSGKERDNGGLRKIRIADERCNVITRRNYVLCWKNSRSRPKLFGLARAQREASR